MNRKSGQTKKDIKDGFLNDSKDKKDTAKKDTQDGLYDGQQGQEDIKQCDMNSKARQPKRDIVQYSLQEGQPGQKDSKYR